MKHRKAAAAAAGLVCLSLIPFRAYAAVDDRVTHLVNALTSTGTMTAADDFNGDHVVNAIDLTLLKRSLLYPQAEGELRDQTVQLNAKSAKLIGRTLADGDTVWLVQSGSAAEFTVTGTEASVTLAGDGNVYSEDAKWRPRYGVFLDGELIADVVMDKPEETVQLFTGKTARTATVKVMHLSEANNGAIGVKSCAVKSSAAQPVRPTAKKDLSIEFIGDSITCAYGVEAETQYVGFSTATENFTLSYAYLTAQLLDADYSAVSYSGHGIISGYSNDGTAQTDSLVPDVYTQVGKQDAYSAEWDFAANPSDVVVLNLGTNDDSYATKDLETRGPEYQKGYEAFLKQIRAKNPDASIICTLGIMGCEELYPYIEKAVANVGDKKITCYQSPTQKSSDGYGADWHPSPVTHQKNAYLLADKICEAIGRPSSKIGIDLAQNGEYGVEIDNAAGANASPYFSDWDKSLWVNVVTGGDSKEAIVAYVRNLDLIAGGYELSFSAQPPAGFTVDYAVRSMSDPTKVYCSGSMNTKGENETVLLPFEMEAADSACEIVFFLGGMNSQSITFRDVTLYKRS